MADKQTVKEETKHKTVFLFPKDGVTIEAETLEEAQKLYSSQTRKESDNG